MPRWRLGLALALSALIVCACARLRIPEPAHASSSSAGAVPLAHGPWQLQTSGLPSGDLLGLSFANARQGWAVAADGAVVGTVDGGAHWSLFSQAVQPPYRSAVAFTSATHGVRVGGTCTRVNPQQPQRCLGSVAVSNDGGRAWTPMAVGAVPRLTAVACPDASHCWAVGDSGTVLASTDGGVRWSAQDTGTSANLTAITCADDLHCLTVGAGGAILATTDGGRNWVGRTPAHLHPPDLAAAACAGPADCLVAGVSGTLLLTTDGGLAWVAVKSGVATPFLAATCPTAATCLVSGGSGTILRGSITAGAAGRWRALRSGTGQPLFAVTCRTAAQCWAAGSTGLVLATADGGLHWRTQARGAVYDAVAVAPRAHVWVVGQGGQVLASADGGATWQGQATPTTDTLTGVAFTSTLDGWAVGMLGTMLRTTDGGRRWTAVTGLPAHGALLAITCPASGRCLAVGGGGGALVLSAVGRWVFAHTGVNTPLFGAACADAARCVAVGADGAVVATADGGRHWSPGALPGGATPTLLGVACPGAAPCWAVGATTGGQGVLYRSADGGHSWTLTLTAPTPLSAVACSSGQDCWASGDHGTVASTTDGGVHWHVAGTGSGADFYGVAAAATQGVWLVGTDTAVLHGGA